MYDRPTDVRRGDRVAADAPPAHRVLVIDDSKAMTELLASCLADIADVAVAHSGDEGLQRALTFEPHVMLVDIVLPQFSGFEVVDALYRRRDGIRPKVIFITGLREPANDYRARELGALTVLHKPLDPDQVRRAVLAALYLSPA